MRSRHREVMESIQRDAEVVETVHDMAVLTARIADRLVKLEEQVKILQGIRNNQPIQGAES